MFPDVFFYKCSCHVVFKTLQENSKPYFEVQFWMRFTTSQKYSTKSFFKVNSQDVFSRRVLRRHKKWYKRFWNECT